MNQPCELQKKFQMKFHQLNDPNSGLCQNDAPAWNNRFNSGKGVRGMAQTNASSILRPTLLGESLQENGAWPTPRPVPSYDLLREKKAFKRGAREAKARPILWECNLFKNHGQGQIQRCSILRPTLWGGSPSQARLTPSQAKAAAGPERP